MSFQTYKTPKGNTFKLITRTDNIQIGYKVFVHNENPSLLREENVEMRSVNYIGIHLCASVIPDTGKGMDIPKELHKIFPSTEWMQVDPMYAFCTIGVNMDVRLLKNKDSQVKSRLSDILNGFYKLIFIDICAKSKHSMAEKAEIKKDIRKELLKCLGFKKSDKETNWDKELMKLMGGTDGEEKKVQ